MSASELALRPDVAAAFPPTRAAALERARAVDPSTYARTRNHLRGAVSRLSPYLTHGLASAPDVLQIAAPDAAGKFAQELAWREFFQLVYEREGRSIFTDRFGPQPRRSAAFHPRRLPRAIVEGSTGIDALDDAVRALVQGGYVHNHARMWLASVGVSRGRRGLARRSVLVLLPPARRRPRLQHAVVAVGRGHRLAQALPRESGEPRPLL
ncbi:MAG: FAD-binding domain-containing protein [Trueperaceae bacterium]|nr:FAD-binding domain-containing protein [Trueperaceae bacterium]